MWGTKVTNIKVRNAISIYSHIINCISINNQIKQKIANNYFNIR